ncbi:MULTISPECIES: PspC domain-containing protein [Persicobacter]|uniref:PspC family transcriptional regulator n=1 Tax=Persicobacter diffluens TaxID=981 RepID=A0AAN4VW34_9BACT|nr:PspC domain-containing protein [Persicobacter sp. CCB-QB2]GJM60773.1 PspC family transcriptional regulator [Persicobacter diffluens]
MRKNLTRPVNRKIIAGVCAGVADYFNLDPVIIRLIYVFLLLFAGTGLALYIILWIIMPAEQY